MAKAFSEENIEQIRKSLLAKGAELFARYGLKKTSVEDLARAVGIAKGSFYRFFESKEALFMAIHEESEKKLRTEMMAKMESIEEPAEKLRFFLKSAFALLEDDPLMRVIFSRGEMENLSGFLTTGQYQEHYRQNIVFMNELIRQWQKEGAVRDVDPEVAGNLIGSSFFMYIQKDTLGKEMYDRVTDMLVESLVCYLAGTGKENG